MRIAVTFFSAALAIAATAALAKSGSPSAAHPNGLKLEILSATTVAEGVVVRLEARAAQKQLRINRRGRELTLTSENGEFKLVPPTSDPEIHVPADSTLDASLVFTYLPRTSPDPGPVTLTTNSQTGSADDPRSAIPKLSITMRTTPGDEVLLPRHSRILIEPSAAGDASIARLKQALGAIEITNGTMIRLPADDFFEPGKDALSGALDGDLDKVRTLIRRLKPKAITVVAHGDGQGEPAASQDVTERQAKAIAARLARDGEADPARTTPAGAGNSSPIARGSASDEAQRRNRRIEIVLQ